MNLSIYANRKKSTPLIFTLSSLFATVTAGVGSYLYLTYKPYIPVIRQLSDEESLQQLSYNHSSLSPIISYVQKAHNRKLPLNYTITDYNNTNSDVFDYLAVRTLSIGALVNRSDEISPYYRTKSVGWTNGTGFILGPANEETKKGNDHWYYLASNIHVLDAFTNRNFIQGFYGISPYLLNKAQYHKRPSVSELSTDLDKLKLTYDPNNIQANNYYKMIVDPTWKYFATDINSTKKDSGFGPLAVDFGVIKVNLKPLTNQYQHQTPLTHYSSFIPDVYNHPLTRSLIHTPVHNDSWLSLLTDNIRRYGDVHFPKTVPYDGAYLMGYPRVNSKRKQDDLSAVPVNLFLDKQLENLVNKDRSSTPGRLKVGGRIYYTPVSDYKIPYLNLFSGSSGSPIISYDRLESDFSKRFAYHGIYWGVVFKKADSDDTKFDPKNIGRSQGMITKVYEKEDYDVIGAEKINASSNPTQSPSTNNKANTLCNAIKKNYHYHYSHSYLYLAQPYIPSYCIESPQASVTPKRS